MAVSNSNATEGEWTAEQLEAYKVEVRIENAVRRRLQDILASGGMSSDGVAKEVLFWLPAEFIAWYEELFLKAVVLKGRQALGVGSEGAGGDREADLGRAKVDSKEYKGKVVGAGKGGAGKRFWRGEWIVKDQGAFDRLRQVEWELKSLVLGFHVFHGYDWSKGEGLVGKITERPMEKGRVRRVCGDCGKIMKIEWGRCPFHEG